MGAQWLKKKLMQSDILRSACIAIHSILSLLCQCIILLSEYNSKRNGFSDILLCCVQLQLQTDTSNHR